MRSRAIATWAVALVFAALIGTWVVHDHRIQDRICAHGTKHACEQARKNEDGPILLGILGAVFLVTFGGLLLAAKK